MTLEAATATARGMMTRFGADFAVFEQPKAYQDGWTKRHPAPRRKRYVD